MGRRRAKHVPLAASADISGVMVCQLAKELVVGDMEILVQQPDGPRFVIQAQHTAHQAKVMLGELFDGQMQLKQSRWHPQQVCAGVAQEAERELAAGTASQPDVAKPASKGTKEGPAAARRGMWLASMPLSVHLPSTVP